MSDSIEVGDGDGFNPLTYYPEKARIPGIMPVIGEPRPPVKGIQENPDKVTTHRAPLITGGIWTGSRVLSMDASMEEIESVRREAYQAALGSLGTDTDQTMSDASAAETKWAERNDDKAEESYDKWKKDNQKRIKPDT